MGPKPKPLHERYVLAENGCWLWQGARLGPKRREYGSMKWHGRHRVAHQVYYEEFVGAIPAGREIHHVCNESLCVNPEHLRAVTREENMHAKACIKLSWENVQAIRASRDPAKVLAERFKVHLRTIYKVRAGEGWAYSYR